MGWRHLLKICLQIILSLLSVLHQILIYQFLCVSVIGLMSSRRQWEMRKMAIIKLKLCHRQNQDTVWWYVSNNVPRSPSDRSMLVHIILCVYTLHTKTFIYMYMYIYICTYTTYSSLGAALPGFCQSNLSSSFPSCSLLLSSSLTKPGGGSYMKSRGFALPSNSLLR